MKFVQAISFILNSFSIFAETLGVSLNDDPSLYPGHLEPLGARQRKELIETLTEYPSPQDFFEKYVKPGRPFLVKQVGKNQRAYKHWTDDYMKSFEMVDTELVQVEPNLKEKRESFGIEVTLKEFIDRYHKEEIYMVHPVPSFLQKDVMMPPPLTCNNTRDLMLEHVTWMSSGGTKSVLHSDSSDNINCLFRGSKDLLLINPEKYAGKVPIDKPFGGYSTLDVEKVNFTKFPTLREVEYIECHMEEGDCLFIPYEWYHQVNSAANSNNQNIAVNIWFTHAANHKPKNCTIPTEETTLNKYTFHKMSGFSKGPEAEGDLYPLINLYKFTLSSTKYNRANFNTFCTILRKIPGIFVASSIEHMAFTDELKQLYLEMFTQLNVNNDKYIKEDDFELIFADKEIAEKIEDYLEERMGKVNEILIFLESKTSSGTEKPLDKESSDDDTKSQKNEL